MSELTRTVSANGETTKPTTTRNPNDRDDQGTSVSQENCLHYPERRDPGFLSRERVLGPNNHAGWSIRNLSTEGSSAGRAPRSYGRESFAGRRVNCYAERLHWDGTKDVCTLPFEHGNEADPDAIARIHWDEFHNAQFRNPTPLPIRRVIENKLAFSLTCGLVAVALIACAVLDFFGGAR